MPNRKSSSHRTLPSEVAVPLGAALREARQRRSLTQEYLAAGSQVSVQMVRRLEAGTANPTLGTLHAVTHTLGISVADLLTNARI